MAHIISFNDVNFTYNVGTPFATPALFDVSFSIPKGQVTAIVGHTGSGKSTVLQHLNVLLQPTSGSIQIMDETITSQKIKKSLKPLRKEVGVVFQFPEAQLFEETVLKDVMFGPLNFGKSEEEAQTIAKRMLQRVGIGEELYDRSPFDLSGGQMRRVAIAGILAIEPSILVLDEPTAGLDPLGHKEIMDMFMHLQKEEELTLILVTHQMEDVATYADYVIVIEKGTVVGQGTPGEIFSDIDWLKDKQLELPQSMTFMLEYLQKTNQSVGKLPYTIKELAFDLANDQLKEGRRDVR